MLQMPCVLLMPRTVPLFFIARGARKGQQIVFRSDLLCTMEMKRTYVTKERQRGVRVEVGVGDWGWTVFINFICEIFPKHLPLYLH